MRRRGLRAAMLVVVATALAGIAFQVWTSTSATRPDPSHELDVELIPDVAQRIRGFKRVKMEDGRPVWEVSAKEAQYFEKQELIVVVEPRVTFYFDDGEQTASLAGKEGRLQLAGRELTNVELRGGVTVLLDDLRMNTNEASYDRARDLIVAANEVTIRGRSLDVRARGMEVEVEPQRMRLLADVHTVLEIDALDS
jgi:LPS export ABC transporter protein LptC